MPIRSAITMAGIGNARAITGLASTAAMATAADSARPGATVRSCARRSLRVAAVRPATEYTPARSPPFGGEPGGAGVELWSKVRRPCQRLGSTRVVATCLLGARQRRRSRAPIKLRHHELAVAERLG